jgi:hypothetical protein
MMKKTLFILLVLVVFAFNWLSSATINSAQASTQFTEVPKVTKFFKAVGQKLGIDWFGNSLDIVAQYLVGQYNNNNPDQLSGIQLIGRIPVMDVQIGPSGNLDKFIASAEDFEDAVSLLDGARKKIVKDTVVPIYGTCQKEPYGANGVNPAHRKRSRRVPGRT